MLLEDIIANIILNKINKWRVWVLTNKIIEY
jgi:hypothetical protein